MQIRSFLPDSRSLELEKVESDELAGRVSIWVRSVAESSQCPGCQQLSQRIHSRYKRKLWDLPWQGCFVQIVWSSRRFFCDVADCSRKIFTERREPLAAAYARRTGRLSLILRCIGLACGGEPGVRIVQRLGIQASSDTILREVRSSPITTAPMPRVVGIDDWAYRKRHRYGTLICDLESGRVIDLLPDRDANSLAQWLGKHPSISVIGRDRGDVYRKGATMGAPKAIQVADRFHLIKNLRDAFARFLEGQSTQIQQSLLLAQSTSQTDHNWLTQPIAKDSLTVSAR